ncbi:required for drug-induced death protein 1 [Salminus brasiliensis]|uniref:required for drug-induced death protein 1 n=1 Tax=Salminus brasiliensis TaxID=930266 RepID=UPI003B8323C1
MTRRQLRKSRKKSKSHKNEDKSKIIDCVDEECEGPRSEKSRADSDRQRRPPEKSSRKSAKQVHIAVLPDRYEPLEEDQPADTAPEKSEKKKQENYKKFRKNIGKALRYSWKCLVVGLQSFSSAYSGPLSAAVTLVPTVQRTQSSV